MAVSHSIVAVNTTAVAILAAKARGQRTGNRRNVIIQNKGANIVFLGGAGVTAAAHGHELATNGVLQLSIAEGDALYGVASTGPNNVKVLAV